MPCCPATSAASSVGLPRSWAVPVHHDRHAENIALAAHGLDVRLVPGVVEKTLAQPAHQKVDGAVEKLRVTALGEVEQLVAGEHALRMVEEDAEQPKLGAAQRYDRAVLIEQVPRCRIQPPAP